MENEIEGVAEEAIPKLEAKAMTVLKFKPSKEQILSVATGYIEKNKTAEQYRDWRRLDQKRRRLTAG